jgi:hypothetical protein
MAEAVPSWKGFSPRNNFSVRKSRSIFQADRFHDYKACCQLIAINILFQFLDDFFFILKTYFLFNPEIAYGYVSKSYYSLEYLPACIIH